MPVILSIIAGLILILDLIGNTIVIHVIRTQTPSRTTTDLLIVNLAIADLLMIPVIVFLVKHFFVGFGWFGGIIGQITCRLVISLQALSVLSSVYTICAICVDRFCAIFFPLKCIFTRSRIKLCIAFVWLIAVAFAVPQFIVAVVRVMGNSAVCVQIWKNSGLSSDKYTIFFVVIGYGVPLVTIATLYLVTGAALWKSTAPGHQSEVARERIRDTRRKPTKMLVTIVIAFALCWLPLHVAEVIRRFAPQMYFKRIPIDVNIVLPWFGIANSAINPFIYPIFCEKFRSEFRKVLYFPFMKKWKRRKSDLTFLNALSNFSTKQSYLKTENNTPSSPSGERRKSDLTFPNLSTKQSLLKTEINTPSSPARERRISCVSSILCEKNTMTARL